MPGPTSSTINTVIYIMQLGIHRLLYSNRGRGERGGRSAGDGSGRGSGRNTLRNQLASGGDVTAGDPSASACSVCFAYLYTALVSRQYGN